MIWLIGCNGMLGRELAELFDARGLAYVGSDREVDILDPAALAAFASGKQLAWVINCAAYTAVDRAEDEEALAARLNADGPGNIARLCGAIGARLIHISTDYVFGGDGTRPYLESDPPAPTGVYGRTKAEGERRVFAELPGAIIIRTAWLYGRHGPNFVYTMLKLMKSKDEFGVVSDQRGTPTWARDLARAMADMVSAPAFPAGIYHYTNLGETNWHAFARAIQQLGLELGLLDKPCRINALGSDQYPTKARRPAYSVLSKDKALAAGLIIPAWKDSLREFLANEKKDA